MSAARTRRPPVIRLAELPQLRAPAWHLNDSGIALTPQEAFELDERNWRHVDREALSRYEAKVIERLTETIGHGLLLSRVPESVRDDPNGPSLPRFMSWPR